MSLYRTLVCTAAVALLLFVGTPASQAAIMGNGDGLMNVHYIHAVTTVPGNTTANWLNVWNALDIGGGPTGTVAGYNITDNVIDTEVNFDYAGGGSNGNFGLNRNVNTINDDGPGGGPHTGYSGGGEVQNQDYSIRAQTFLEFVAGGTYTLGLGSDDGRRISLTEASPGSAPGYAGFSSAGGQIDPWTAGDTVIGWTGGTGHQWTVGVFTVNPGDILALDSFYYEGTGGDSGELALAATAQTGFTNTTDFNLIQDNMFNGLVRIHSAIAPLIPEPMTATLGLLGLGGLGLVTRRRRRA